MDGNITTRKPVKEKKPGLSHTLAESILPYFPDLKKKLYLANIPGTSVQLIEKTIIATIYLSLGVTILLALVFNIFFINPFFSILTLPFVAIGVFYYLLLYPEVKIIQKQRQIDSELVFAGRHVLIALRAGMPLFDCLVGVTSGYGAVSDEIHKIIDKVNLGVPMGQAMREAGASSPSGSYSRIMIQLANALSSGADIGSSLENVLNQIAKEQTIELKAYGQKLNPLMMFFMIFGIVFPSLGVAFAIILFSLVSGGSIGLSSSSLIYVILVIGMVQFLFLTVVESTRPKYLV